MISELQYQSILESRLRALRKLELEFGFFLKDVGDIDVYATTSRMKSYESAIRKSRKLNIDVQELHDLAGMRVIVGTRDEIPIVERFFTRQEIGGDLHILKRDPIARKNGYRALHLIVEFPGHYQRSGQTGCVEVQIHTILGHAFNFLSRSWKYKLELELPEEWEQRFVHISSVLNQLEETAESLHANLLHETVSLPSSPLTPSSLRLLTQEEFTESLSASDAVDYCRMYVDMGYRTNGHFRAFLQSPKIWELYRLLENRENRQDSQVVRELLKLGKAGFWNIFGTRISEPGLRGYFEHLIQEKA